MEGQPSRLAAALILSFLRCSSIEEHRFLFAKINDGVNRFETKSSRLVMPISGIIDVL